MAKPKAIIQLEDFDESINMIVYGDSGVGKTVLAGTCPNALILATESGTVSAARQGLSADLWKIDKWDDLVAAYDWIHDNPGEYDWIAIDSATDMQALCMRGILNKSYQDKGHDPDIPALKDYQKWYNMFERFVAGFNALPANVLWTARTMRQEDEEGEDIVLPDIQGKGYHNAQTFCGAATIVAYYKETVKGGSDNKEHTRKLLFNHNPPYFAKDRYAVMPRWLTISRGDQWVNDMGKIAAKLGQPTPQQKSTPRKKRAAKSRGGHN